MSLEKIIVGKKVVRLVFKVKLPIVGDKVVVEDIRAEDDAVVFPEPISVYGVRYLEGCVELLVKPITVAFKPKAKDIVEAIEKYAVPQKIAEAIGISIHTAKISVRAYEVLKKGKVVASEDFEGKKLYIVKLDGDKYYVVNTGRTLDYRMEIDKIARRFGKATAEKFREIERKLMEKKRILSDRDVETLKKVRRYFKEEQQLKRLD